MAGFKEQSPGLLACVLCLMIPAYISLFARIFVRVRKKVWGIDDWCMAYAAWWNIFSFFYCNSMVPIKLGIAWQIGRIASNETKIMRVLYGVMFFSSLTLIAVFIFQLIECHPVAYSWDKSIHGGHCLDPKYLTVLSFTMSGINITTDFICACLPISFLWDIQMNSRKKILVGMLLCMGVLGSVAALVRLKYTVALNEATDFTFTIGVLACWTIAEPGIGYTAANLALCISLF
ncbi:hypothetical protein F5884DRAFT_850002 [Xylogone sp. PMI_703]|nr:hypothetical protein F5884DRAFT_850002 [Xylogone sp. PMI_703]